MVGLVSARDLSRRASVNSADCVVQGPSTAAELAARKEQQACEPLKRPLLTSRGTARHWRILSGSRRSPRRSARSSRREPWLTWASWTLERRRHSTSQDPTNCTWIDGASRRELASEAISSREACAPVYTRAKGHPRRDVVKRSPFALRRNAQLCWSSRRCSCAGPPANFFIVTLLVPPITRGPADAL